MWREKAVLNGSRRFRRNCGIFTRAPEGRSEFCPGLGRAEAKSKSTAVKTRKRGDRHRKSEGWSIRVVPGSRQKGGTRAGAGSSSTETRSHLGTWRRWRAPPRGPRTRTFSCAYLVLPPAEGKREILSPTIRCAAPPGSSRRRRPVGRTPKATQPTAAAEGRAKEVVPPSH